MHTNLRAEGMDQVINETIADCVTPFIREDTLIVVDPTDVRKACARRKPYLGTVRDGSTGALVPGYCGAAGIGM